MMHSLRLVVAAGFASIVAFSSATFAQPSSPTPAPNEISILFLWPGEVPLAALDHEIPVTAEVTYAMTLADTATVQVEMNLSHPTQFTKIAEAEVKRGQGTIRLNARVTVGKRDPSQPLLVRARFADPLRNDQGREFISTTRAIAIGQRPKGSVDEIVILGCDPERLVPDREQEVGVVISYDLKTTAKGEINLGFNSDDPKAYAIFTSRVVEKGSGQIVLTAKVKPRAWGEKVFFQAFVNLSEYPHTRAWSPLADDSEPIELATP
jgi:hypothetical protein